jgi:glycosyltransferase involved in cell wall biosynthesis
MYAARQLGCRFSFTGHAADLFRDRVLLPEKLARAAFVACISNWHRAFYCSLVSRPDEAYPLVRCGVDPAEFAPAPPRAAVGPLRIVAVGRLVPKKGFDLLVDALGTLRAECVPFTCKLLGDGPEREALAARVAALGLQAQVELAGAAQNAAVRAALAAADLFVLPCRQDSDGDRDGIPVALMEAMACAVCAVSGDLPAIRELIEDGKTGYLTPPGDAAALAGLLGRLAGRADERLRVAQAGRAHIEREFALAANSLRLQQAFAKLNRD